MTLDNSGLPSTNTSVESAHEAWKKRNDVMLVALRDDNRVIAAGWFNLDHEPNKEEKKEVREFYRDSAGMKIEILRGDDVKRFKGMEWI